MKVVKVYSLAVASPKVAAEIRKAEEDTSKKESKALLNDTVIQHHALKTFDDCGCAFEMHVLSGHWVVSFGCAGRQ